MKTRKLLSILALFGLGTLLFAGCSSEEETPVIEKPVTWAENHSLIVCMHGDNGLNEFMDTNQQRLLSAFYEVPETGRLFLFYDRGNYTRLTEIYINDGMVKQRLIEEYPAGRSSANLEFMQGVFERVYAEAPETKSWGAVLSSHGGGWVPSEVYDQYLNYDWYEIADPLKRRPLFYAQDGEECLEIADWVKILQGKHFDYILFDACFMASVEALYDLRHSADYLIASPAEVRGEGFPYDKIIPLMFREDHGLQACCEAFVTFYKNRAADPSATISLVECAHLEGLAAAMKQVLQAADNTIDPTQIQGYECFPIHLYYDLEQYVEQLTDDEALRQGFREALHRAVRFCDHTPTFISSAWRVETIDLPRSAGLTCHVEREEFPATHAAWLQTAWAQAIGAE